MSTIEVIQKIVDKNNIYREYKSIIINGIDYESKTYKVSEYSRGSIKELLKNLHNDNKYNIKVANIPRETDRNYTAKYFQIPVTAIAKVYNYDEANEISAENNLEIYTQIDGQEYMLIGRTTYELIVRLYILTHNIGDNRLPYFFDRRGNRVSQLSFKQDMFFSDYKQAYNKQQHIFDFSKIEEIFINPDYDLKTIVELVY